MSAEYIWTFFKLHDLIHVVLAKMYLLLLKINTLVAIFKCLQKIFYKEKKLVFGVWIVQFIVFVAASNTRPNEQ